MSKIKGDTQVIKEFVQASYDLFENDSLYSGLKQEYRDFLQVKSIIDYYLDEYEDLRILLKNLPPGEGLEHELNKYLRYIWKSDYFLKIKGGTSIPQEDTLYKLTREIHLKVKSKTRIQIIFDSIFSERFGPGFKFLLARAISIMNNLQIPALFEDSEISEMAKFLGLKINSKYPSNAIEIKEFIDNTFSQNLNHLTLRYVLPKMIHDNLIKTTLNSINIDQSSMPDSEISSMDSLNKEFIESTNTSLDKPVEDNIGKEFYSGFNSELYKSHAEDKMDITPDVKAFASLIAHTKVEPPIAIGLFGNWGSGKSFFMNKLQEQVDEYRKEKYIGFTKNVVHIKFNAWHYSDSNLWACIMNNIFDSLKKYGSENHGEKEIKELLYQKLENSKKMFNEASKAVDIATAEKVAAEKEAKNIFEKKAELKNFFNNLMQVPFLEIALKEKGSAVRELQKELKLDTNLEALNNEIRLLNKDFRKLVKVFSLHPYVALIMLCSIIAAIGIGFLVPIAKSDGFITVTSLLIKSGIQAAIGIGAPFFMILKWIRPHFRKIKSIAKEIGDYSQNYIEEEKDRVRKNIEELEENEKAANLKKKEAEERIRVAQKELDDIKDGKKLMQFITERSGSDDYQKHLGIISMISRDLNSLKKELENVEEGKLKIERIILYIDDLDRCTESKVIEVLEAIHLLLASELFVVIVGVDPRWVSHALSTKYSKLLSNEMETTVTNSTQASTYDYLEKIFQIPFVLRPISKKGTIGLIEDLLNQTSTNNISSDLTTNSVVFSTNNSNSKKKRKESDLIIEETTQPLKRSEEEQTIEKNEIKEAQLAYDRIIITPQEIEFMKKIADILGESPRTVKRYINTYRLIRSYKDFDNPDGKLEKLKVIMVLLALVTSNGKVASLIPSNLYKNSTGDLKDLMISISSNPNIKNDSNLNKIKNFIISDVDEIASIPMDAFRDCFPLISKFSFRNLEVTEIFPTAEDTFSP